MGAADFFGGSREGRCLSRYFCDVGADEIDLIERLLDGRGPMVLPSIQIEKKMPFIPPSFMRGMSMEPVSLRLPRSKVDFERNRCVVSSCVSTDLGREVKFAGARGNGISGAGNEHGGGQE